MNNKTTVSTRYLSLLYWFMAGFVLPFFVNLVLGFILGIFLVAVPLLTSPIVSGIVFYVVGLFGLLIGIQFTSKWLGRRYVIPDAEKVARYASLYMLAIGLVLRIAGIIMNGAVQIETAAFLLTVVIFYFLSKRFIENNTAIADMSIPQAPTVPTV